MNFNLKIENDHEQNFACRHNALVIFMTNHFTNLRGFAAEK